VTSCVMICHCLTGNVLNPRSAQTGAQLDLVGWSTTPEEHFCFLDNGGISHLASGTAVAIARSPATDVPLALAAIDGSQPLQRWSFKPDGTLRPELDPTYAVAPDAAGRLRLVHV